VATHTFSQIDVFGSRPLMGNPVAVVHDATGLADEQMAAFARWTNLSETTFLLPAEDPTADYRLRIFTPGEEPPFAGHPTLGSAHAWLAAGGTPAAADHVTQECGIGLVELSRDGDAVSFRAPDFVRTGPVDEETLGRVLGALGVEAAQLLDAWWIDNGPGWLGLELDSAATVLSLRPSFADLDVDAGVIGRFADDEREAAGADVEVRAFCPGLGINEDPVTGSLNAGFALWLTGAGRLPTHYVARQGTSLGRDGRVHVRTDDTGGVWVGGSTRTVVTGTVDL